MFKRKVSREKTSIKILEGLMFTEEGDGILTIDARNIAKPRIIGIIVRIPFDTNFMLCPFLKKGLLFDLKPPSKFRTASRAQDWVEKHSVSYNDNRIYTPFNPLTKYILSEWITKSPLVHLRFQVILTNILLSLFFFYHQPVDPNPVISISAKVIGGTCLILGIINILIFIRERI